MIGEQTIQKDERLILALDKPTRRNKMAAMIHVMRRFGGVKLTPEFIRNEDYLAVGGVAVRQGLPIIYDSNTSHSPRLLQRSVDALDLKLNEGKIPKEGQNTRYVEAVTFSGIMPVEWMKEIAEKAHAVDLKTKLLVVGASPDMTEAQIRRIHRCSPAEWTAEVANNGREAGMDGLIASPVDAEGLFNDPDDPFKLWTVGLRYPSQDMFGKDPSRVGTPLEAVAVNAYRFIIGNLITSANDPVAAADDLVQELRPSYDQRVA